MKKNSVPTSRSLGIGYMGSKNAIAYNIVEQLPEAETFVDLFAGGCAVTHAAILSGKYRRFILNDINQTPSEYVMPEEGFEEVAAWPKRCTLSSASNSRHTVEKLFKVKH